MNMEELLNQYNWITKDSTLEYISKTSYMHKDWINDLMRKYPNYIEGKRQIVIDVDVPRPIDFKKIDEFQEWVCDSIPCPTEIIKHNHTYKEVCRYINTIYEKIKLANELGYTDVARALNEDYERYLQYKKDYIDENTQLFRFVHVVTKNDVINFKKDRTMLGLLSGYKNQFLDKEIVENLNSYNRHEHLKFAEGMKTSRAMSKVCHILGIDKDEEYNHMFYSVYADSINPNTQKMKMVISVNPIDYLTMSFGNSWASCHTIDKENIRGSDKTYSGAYCSGTMSYMLDSSAIIVYFVKDSVTENFEEADKVKRCMFFIDKSGCMIQSRVYPDGRETPTLNPAKEIMRNKMQEIFSDLMNFENSYMLSHGSNVCGEYTLTDDDSTHYKDYIEYDDAVYMRPKSRVNKAVIAIGHAPICVNCGEEHYREDSLYCHECEDNIVTCRCCGREFIFDPNENVEISSSELYFCDEDCAERYGYIKSYNDEWIDENEAVWDDYYNDYFHESEIEEWVSTREGKTYISPSNAKADGNVYCDETEEWIDKKNSIYDFYTRLTYDASKHAKFTYGKYTFISQENMNIYCGREVVM